MARSQNVTFLGEAPPHQEFSHPIGEGLIFLQVAPVRVAGLVDRVLRRVIPDVSHECLQISRAIDETLKSSGKYSRIRWREDGPPDEANSSNEPGGRR
jgi:hypothetical protein